MPFTPDSDNINPFDKGLINAFPPLTAMKLTELYENTASMADLPVLVNEYSIPATGRLELSASVGINGLQAFIETLRGTSGSSRAISA